MGLQDTPSAERVHIAFFGRRNAGKSSLLNAVTGQDLAVVSDVRGTTTDPVQKSMELLPLGPVVVIDTPGIDDAGTLGELRVKKTRQVLNRTDVAVLVADAAVGILEAERQLLSLFAEKQIPFLIAYNKCDLLRGEEAATHRAVSSIGENGRIADTGVSPGNVPTLCVSALRGTHIWELKEAIAALAAREETARHLVGDLVSPGDVVVLVTPIDSAAPKGRIILPQQMAIRDLLECGALSVVVRETEVAAALSALQKPPALVVTDSQAFARVGRDVPKEIPLTSFSILMARYKGTLQPQAEGARHISRLKDGDTVLISEGCTHHRQCDDIGTVKLPRWLCDFTGKRLQFRFTSGGDFPEDLSGCQLVIHCGGCMRSDREMRARIQTAVDAGVPVTNYGMAIAYVHGTFARSMAAINKTINKTTNIETRIPHE